VKLRTSWWGANSWVIVAALLATVSAGCDSTAALDTGPLGNGGQPGVECDPVHNSTQSLTNGFTALSNSSTSPVVIDRVALDDPQHLRLLGAYIVPITGHTLIGDWAAFPPTASELALAPGAEWAQRVAAAGARIGPDRPNQVVNLIVVVKPEGPAGTTKGLDIYYSGGGTQYHMLTTTQFRVVVSPPDHC